MTSSTLKPAAESTSKVIDNTEDLDRRDKQLLLSRTTASAVIVKHFLEKGLNDRLKGPVDEHKALEQELKAFKQKKFPAGENESDVELNARALLTAADPVVQEKTKAIAEAKAAVSAIGTCSDRYALNVFIPFAELMEGAAREIIGNAMDNAVTSGCKVVTVDHVRCASAPTKIVDGVATPIASSAPRNELAALYENQPTWLQHAKYAEAEAHATLQRKVANDERRKLMADNPDLECTAPKSTGPKASEYPLHTTISKICNDMVRPFIRSATGALVYSSEEILDAETKEVTSVGKKALNRFGKRAPGELSFSTEFKLYVERLIRVDLAYTLGGFIAHHRRVSKRPTLKMKDFVNIIAMFFITSSSTISFDVDTVTNAKNESKVVNKPVHSAFARAERVLEFVQRTKPEVKA